MTFSDEKTRMREEVYTRLGVLVTFTPVGGAAVDILAIVKYGEGEDSEGSDAYNTEAMMRIRAQATIGIVTIQNGDVVAIGAESWRVVDAKKIADGGEWQCAISRLNR